MFKKGVHVMGKPEQFRDIRKEDSGHVAKCAASVGR
jgi:hypothetical protein